MRLLWKDGFIVTTGGVRPNDEGKDQIDGSTVVREVVDNGSRGEQGCPPMASPEPARLLGVALFQGDIQGMSD